jgi:hypothetical protein
MRFSLAGWTGARAAGRKICWACAPRTRRRPGKHPSAWPAGAVSRGGLRCRRLQDLRLQPVLSRRRGQQPAAVRSSRSCRPPARQAGSRRGSTRTPWTAGTGPHGLLPLGHHRPLCAQRRHHAAATGAPAAPVPPSNGADRLGKPAGRKRPDPSPQRAPWPGCPPPPARPGPRKPRHSPPSHSPRKVPGSDHR